LRGRTTERIRLLARAKINYSIEIKGLRSDGYHELSSVFQSITLADELTLERAGRGFELIVEPEAADIGPWEWNTVHRAWRVLAEHTGTPLPIRAHLQKNVPAGGGLGGGSSDGAATLVGLNALFGLGLDTEALQALARGVGADVPFCVCGGTALATGVGEKLEALPGPPEHHLVIAMPAFEANTAQVYRAFDASPGHETLATGPVVEALGRGDLAALASALGNDLAPVTEEMCPDVARLRGALLRAGALGACMTGSGSAVFGIFRDAGGARRAAAGLDAPFVSVCEPAREGVALVG
jgi:4-diphosphocytidyl-2-C-methyl-D-erythritol kinase